MGRPGGSGTAVHGNKRSPRLANVQLSTQRALGASARAVRAAAALGISPTDSYFAREARVDGKSNGKINESHGNATTNALPAPARILQCFLTSQDLRLLRCVAPATAHLTPVASDSLLVRVCRSASGNEAAKQLIRSWAPQTTAIATGVVLINNPENMRRFVRARILLEEANTGCIASFDDSLSVVRALHASRRRTPSPSSRAAPAHDYPTLTCGSLHRAGDLSLLSLGTPTAAAAVAGRGGPDADPR